MKKVFISTTSFAKDDPAHLTLLKDAGLNYVLNPLGKKLNEEEIAGFLLDTDYLIAGTETLTRSILQSAKKLKIISRVGVGLDNVDLKAAGELEIKVFNTPQGPTQAVAELVIGFMLDLLRKSSAMDRDIRKGVWKKQMGNLLKGKKVGIVGFGRIGQKVAQLLIPFETEIAYFDINALAGVSVYTFKPFYELLKWSDILTFHCPAEGNGRFLLGEAELKTMKPGAWLVNAARGGLVDEVALAKALEEGSLSGAALDVFTDEPYAGSLAGLDNVILTPHIGSYAKESRMEMELQAVLNLLDEITKI